MGVIFSLPTRLLSLLEHPTSLYFIQLKYALGWTVVHALWQGSLIALLLAVVLSVLRKQRAHIRYIVAVCAQMLMLACGLITFSLLLESPETISASKEIMLFQRAEIPEAIHTPVKSDWYHLITVLSDFLNQHIGRITFIWLLGVGLFSLRLLGAWVYTRRLVYRTVLPVSKEWQQRFRHLKSAMHITPAVQLLESTLAKTPMVIGHFKPIILFPIGLLTSLPPAQIEALLAHELAHIRRRDYLVNLLLSVLETLFFFHPAVWWIGSIVRREREYCCDEIAVQTAGSSITFAKALAAISTQQLKPQSLAMAAAGKPKEVLHRVKRILLEQPSNQSEIMEKTIATLLIVGSVCFFFLRADAARTTAAPAASVHTAIITRDSLPTGKITVRQNTNGKSLEAQLENGKIISLRVDGKDIPEETFGAYEKQVSQMLEKMPPRPPVPPRPDTPPMPGMPKSGFFFFDEDSKMEDRAVIIDLNGGDTLILDGSWKTPERLEALTRRLEERAARTRLNLDRLNYQFSDEDAKALEERLKKDLDDIEMSMQWEEFPDIQIDGSFEIREDGPGAELGIFEFPRGRKMNTQQQLERALLRDELIERNGIYKFELSDRALKVNGSKLPDSLRKKYIRLYEDASGMEWDAKNRVVIHKIPEM